MQMMIQAFPAIRSRMDSYRVRKHIWNEHPHICYHGSHHKVGTVWFGRVFKAVARHLRLKYFSLNRDDPTPALLPDTAALVLDQHSNHDMLEIPDIRGSHLIRDPRDIVVSGYYYHLRTDEVWANRPMRRYFEHRPEVWSNLPIEDSLDLSYREFLNRIPKEEGLRAELIRASWSVFKQMADWYYERTNVLELRYENIVGRDEMTFSNVFRHYGFTDEAVQFATEIAMGFSLEKAKKSGLQHIRSGTQGQWKSEFSPALKSLFKDLYGAELIRLGYETDTAW